MLHELDLPPVRALSPAPVGQGGVGTVDGSERVGLPGQQPPGAGLLLPDL